MMVKNFIFLFKLRQKSKIIVNSVGVEARGGAKGGRKMLRGAKLGSPPPLVAPLNICGKKFPETFSYRWFKISKS